MMTEQLGQQIFTLFPSTWEMTVGRGVCFAALVVDISRNRMFKDTSIQRKDVKSSQNQDDIGVKLATHYESTSRCIGLEKSLALLWDTPLFSNVSSPLTTLQRSRNLTYSCRRIRLKLQRNQRVEKK